MLYSEPEECFSYGAEGRKGDETATCDMANAARSQGVSLPAHRMKEGEYEVRFRIESLEIVGKGSGVT